MKLAKSIAELAQHQDRGDHRRIDLPRVPHIEAEGRLGEQLEKLSQLVESPAAGLAVVHVLQAKPPSERAPECWCAKNSRLHAVQPGIGKAPQQLEDGLFIELLKLARRMERDVGEAAEIEMWNR